jgi:predicted glutamine amidotransferase
MCRIFGFRSIINSQVHSSLVSADNTLHDLSQRHPDGWGVAYYAERTPHLIKSTDCAMEDQLFHKISGIVSSDTVLAHIRNSTQGSHSILNSHPFQYGKWVFAHNGNIKNFLSVKEKLINLIDLDLRRFILGTTDSEVIFFIILSKLKKFHDLSKPIVEKSKIISAIQASLDDIIEITGKATHRNDPTPTENYFSFVITSGPIMIAFNGGQDLYSCTYKSSCPEKSTCKFYDKSCENKPEEDMKVNHLILSSEKISGPNIWNLLNAGELIGVDENMKLFKQKLNIEFV